MTCLLLALVSVSSLSLFLQEAVDHGDVPGFEPVAFGFGVKAGAGSPSSRGPNFGSLAIRTDPN